MYYKVVVGGRNWKENLVKVDTELASANITVHQKDTTANFLLLTCNKGCQIEDIKKVLAKFNIGIASYQEAYSSRKPEFFE